MKKLYILAPNDRFNYGDLIFAHILQFYFSKLFDQIIFCSTSSNDLSKLGGHKVEGYHILDKLKKKDTNVIIVAGGASIGIDWGTILGYTMPKLNFLMKVLNKIEIHTGDKGYIRFAFMQIVRKMNKLKTLYPFTPSKNELSNSDLIIYNSLGGPAIGQNIFFEKSQTVKDNLHTVDYISVRDEQSQQCLKSMGVDSYLVADSAILMSKVFTEQDLVKHIPEDIYLLSSKSYLFFQTNLQLGKKYMKKITELLKLVIDKIGCYIVLCPIGIAPGHSDNIALEEIYKSLPHTKCSFIKNVSVWNIMWLISHSRIYVGSSLHGAITAMSFGIPYVCYGPDKLKKYLDTWGMDKEYFAEIDNLYKLISMRLQDKQILSIDKQINSIECSFKYMESLIKALDSRK